MSKKNPYKNIKPYPTRGPQGQMVNPTANDGKGPQDQRIDIESIEDISVDLEALDDITVDLESIEDIGKLEEE